MSEDQDSLEALTPAHFLNMGPAQVIPEPMPELKCLDRWKIVQQQLAIFWKRFQLEYLSSLQQRTKWKLPQRNIQPNDLVLIKDANLPPQKWLMGRVVQTIMGSDGLVRVVSIKTQYGIIKRPIHKLVLFINTNNPLY